MPIRSVKKYEKMSVIVCCHSPKIFRQKEPVSGQHITFVALKGPKISLSVSDGGSQTGEADKMCSPTGSVDCTASLSFAAETCQRPGTRNMLQWKLLQIFSMNCGSALSFGLADESLQPHSS